MDDRCKTIAKIRQEVDGHQSSVLISNNCLKAQRSLLKKFKDEFERQQVECNFISSSNYKLENEIKLEELKLKSLNSALNTIQTANIEAKKEYLLIKERRSEIEERVKHGIQKYEDKWAAAKERFENISFIKNHMEMKNNISTSQEKLQNLHKECERISADVKKKRDELENLDKQRIIQLAEFLFKERPSILKNIAEIESNKNKINADIQKMIDEHKIQNVSANISHSITDIKEILKLNDVSGPEIQNGQGLMLPPIKLQNVDLDVLSIKLDQIRKGESSRSNKRAGSPIFKDPLKKLDTKTFTKNDSLSNYFDMCRITKTDATKDFSNKKLIHVLEDIQIDDNYTQKIVTGINPYILRDVTFIQAANDDTKASELSEKLSQKQKPIESDEAEEIDLTAKNTPDNVLPPTQFMDLSQETLELCKESPVIDTQTCNKPTKEKKVTFDIKEPQPEEMETDSQLNSTVVSTVSYTQAKETMVTTLSLDLSPQFKYSKHTLQTKPENKIVTSKFFEVKDAKVERNDRETVIKSTCNEGPAEKYGTLKENDNKVDFPQSEIRNVSSSKDVQNKEVTGLLFTHGQAGILETFDLSVSTAGYEEGDSDYAHGVDASLLMSPKADDVPVTNEENRTQISQEAPNFLAGLRKTGFSFFGGTKDNEENNAEAQSDSNFTFSFGGEQKKNKGSLFSMFR